MIRRGPATMHRGHAETDRLGDMGENLLTRRERTEAERVREVWQDSRRARERQEPTIERRNTRAQVTIAKGKAGRNEAMSKPRIVHSRCRVGSM